MKWNLPKQWARWWFFISMCLLLFGYGFAAATYQLFPYSLIYSAKEGLKSLRKDWASGLWFPNTARWTQPIYSTGQVAVGKVLLARHTENWDVEIVVIDSEGRIWHRWLLDVGALKAKWKSDPERLNWRTPIEENRLFVHGMVMLPSGDVIFNLENLALIRMRPSGEIAWFKAIKSHHSMELDLDGNIWTCGAEKIGPGTTENPWIDQSILKLDTNGNILQYWSIDQLLCKNGYTGIAYPGLSAPAIDRFHLNDVEPFNHQSPTGLFGEGDVLVSLRNTNTLFVFNSLDSSIKYICCGKFSRQHDPDFIDGYQISVFDNSFLENYKAPIVSRVITLDARDNSVHTHFIDSIYCKTMGRTEWLANRSLLVLNPYSGSVYLVDSKQKVVWAHNYFLSNGERGTVLDARVLRLPLHSIFDPISSN